MSQLTYPFNEKVLANLAYYFMDHNFDAQYLKMLYKWGDRIREKCDLWWARWHGKGQPLFPKLFFKQKGNSTIVYDWADENWPPNG